VCIWFSSCCRRWSSSLSLDVICLRLLDLLCLVPRRRFGGASLSLVNDAAKIEESSSLGREAALVAAAAGSWCCSSTEGQSLFILSPPLLFMHGAVGAFIFFFLNTQVCELRHQYHYDTKDILGF